MKKRAVVLLIIAVIIAGSVYFFSRSQAPFSDADLAYTPPSLTAEENGYELLQKAREHLEIMGDDDSAKLDRQLHGGEWDAEFIHGVLADNQEALAQFEQLHGRRILVPESATLWVDYDERELAQWKALARLSAAKAQQEFHLGNETNSFERLLKLSEIAHELEGAGGAKIHYLVACGMKQLALRQMTNLIAQTTLPCDRLLEYASRLSKVPANTRGLTNVFKRDYQIQLAYIDDMHRGRVPGTTNSSTSFGAATTAKIFLNGKKSRELYARVARLSLESVVQPYGKKSFDSITNIAQRTSTTKLLLSGNPIGQILAGMSIQSQDNFLGRKASENVEVAAVRLLLILRCYEMRNGAPPTSLDALVPDFLPSVPLDDFDGKPLRYSAQKRIIYSVGADLLDAGGQERGKTQGVLDRVFPIGELRPGSPK